VFYARRRRLSTPYAYVRPRDLEVDFKQVPGHLCKGLSDFIYHYYTG